MNREHPYRPRKHVRFQHHPLSEEDTAKAVAQLTKLQAGRPLSPPSRAFLPARVVSVAQLEAKDFYGRRYGCIGSALGDEHEHEPDGLSIVGAA